MTKVGQLGAQGIGKARTGFAKTATALGRRRKLNEAMAVLPRKTEVETKKDGDGGWLYNVAKEARGSHDAAFSAPAQSRGQP